jgi:hypothetical protein
MPKLDLHDWSEDDPIGQSIACANALGVMYFPDNPLKQKQYVVIAIADFISSLKRTGNFENTIDQHLNRVGGLEALRKAPSENEIDKEVQTSTRNGNIAGNILFNIWRTYLLDPDGLKIDTTSIRKEKSFIKNALTGTDNSLTERTISTIWEQMKPVAHLWAAHTLRMSEEKQTHRYPPLNIQCPQALHDFLSIAESFRQFALEYVPHRQKQSFLIETDSWVHPEGFAINSNIMSQQPLSNQTQGEEENNLARELQNIIRKKNVKKFKDYEVQ